MIFPTSSVSQAQPCASPASKPHMLIISDSAERLTRLRALLAVGEVEITGLSSPKEMCSACCGGYDLVVVDVNSESVGGVLKVLRGCKGCTKIPVLVEASRFTADPCLAGLLPTYRAMPCSGSDLITLAGNHITPPAIERRAHGIL